MSAIDDHIDYCNIDKVNNIFYKYMYNGKKVVCEEHSYAYSGNIPCCGIYRCVYCGKLKEDN